MSIMSIIRREYALAVVVAVVSGIITIVSLLLPWVSTVDGVLNAFWIGGLFADSFKIAFMGTAFSFLVFFGCLMIVGGILMLLSFDTCVYIVYAGAILTIVFAVLGLIVSSVIPMVAPHVGAWLCLCCGVAGAVSPKLRVKKAES